MTDEELIEFERAKYEEMWSKQIYRINSPGENIIPTVWAHLGEPADATVTDYGAGEGRVINWLSERGATVNGFDLVKLHPAVEEACLWKLPTDAQTEFGVCFDVLEHIPEHHVSTVLKRMRDRTTICVAFTVATLPCSVGRRFGLTLHETVRPIEWWDKRVSEVFDGFERVETDREWRPLYYGWTDL